MDSKSIETFVRRSVKAESLPPNVAELQRLLDQMSTTEMQEFWMHFAADRALSSTLTLPHWKTKEQRVRFEHEQLSWMFYPKETDAGGKYIIARKDLEEHIKTCLLRHIHNERESRKRVSFFDKTHHMVGVAVLIMVIPFLTLELLAFNKRYLAFTRGGVLFFAALWALYLLLRVVRSLLWRFRAQKRIRPGA